MASDFHIKDSSGNWRTMSEIYIKDSGTWRSVQEAYVKDLSLIHI